MPCSEDGENLVNQDHIRLFSELVNKLPPALKSTAYLHLFNSGGIVHYASCAHSLVRFGGELYRDVMRVSSYVIALKYVQRGEGVGYDFTYRPVQNTTIAVVACGYADGLSTTLSHRGQVLIRGKRYRIVGKICMDMFFVDIGNDTSINNGDEVVIVGKMGPEKISTYDLSQWSSLNFREITCGFGNGLRALKIVR